MFNSCKNMMMGAQSATTATSSFDECDDSNGLDMDHQRYIVEMEKKRQHDEWCQQHQSQNRWCTRTSEVRAMCLVSEASRLEKTHLEHQLQYCIALVRTQESDTSSPPRIRCESKDVTACACLRAPVYRQLLPKFRAMNLLLPHVAAEDLEMTVDDLLETYSCDHDMVEDLLAKYGPEEPEVDPHIWRMSIEYRLSTFKSRWAQIARDVKSEFTFRDNFPNVIRNLSIMRIFLEGSQAQTYSCDAQERSRRDAFHHTVLQELSRKGSLFL